MNGGRYETDIEIDGSLRPCGFHRHRVPKEREAAVGHYLGGAELALC